MVSDILNALQMPSDLNNNMEQTFVFVLKLQPIKSMLFIVWMVPTAAVPQVTGTHPHPKMSAIIICQGKRENFIYKSDS